MNPAKTRTRTRNTLPGTRRARRKERGKDKCKTCGKQTFPSFDQAAAAALRLSRHVGPVRCYPCPTGKGWHLTRLREWIGR